MVKLPPVTYVSHKVAVVPVLVAHPERGKQAADDDVGVIVGVTVEVTVGV